MKRTLIVYCTHNVNDNMIYFLDHGYINSPNVDYIFCFNGLNNKSNVEYFQNAIKFPNVMFMMRDNTGLDFGAWSEIVLKDNMYQQYDYFIFLNNTVRGPFLPVYVKDHWINIFINMLNETTKLVGPSINYYKGVPHVQSFFLCFDKEAMNIAIETGVLTNDINTIYKDKDMRDYFYKDKYVDDYEVGFSTQIIKKGFNIACLLKAFDRIDFRKTKEPALNFEFGSTNHDMAFGNKYFGISFHPYEVIFIKANRDITPEIIDKYTSFHNHPLLHK